MGDALDLDALLSCRRNSKSDVKVHVASSHGMLCVSHFWPRYVASQVKELTKCMNVSTLRLDLGAASCPDVAGEGESGASAAAFIILNHNGPSPSYPFLLQKAKTR